MITETPPALVLLRPGSLEARSVQASFGREAPPSSSCFTGKRSFFFLFFSFFFFF